LLKARSGCSTAAFDPAGERVVTASDDGTGRIWDARTGEPIGKPLRHQGAVFSAAFDAKVERVVTATVCTARIWDVRTGYSVDSQSR
jgi:WD40 repeat protein